MQKRSHGFILSKQTLTYHNKLHLCFWVHTEDGPRQLITPPQQIVFFVYKKHLSQLPHEIKALATIKSVELKHFNQQAVCALYCQTFNDFNQSLEILQNANIPYFENDISLNDRFLMERFIQGAVEFQGEHNSNQVEVINAHCRASNYTPKLTCVSLDIECSQHGVLYSIGLDCKLDQRVIMIGDPNDYRNQDLTNIEWVKSEQDLLLALIRWFSNYDPDVVIGWNVVNFDFRLLVQRAQYHNLSLNLGREQSACTFRKSKQSNIGFVHLPGRVIIDGIDALKSATYNFSSWSLEHVSQELLNQGKQITAPDDRLSEIKRMFEHDKPALAKYNLQDCILVTQIFAKTHLLDFLIERAKLTGLALDKMGGSVAAFSNLYLPRLHRSGYIAPNLEMQNWQASPGGYVMDSKPGLYQSVLVLDFKSLYPSIIRTFLIDPLGLIEGLKLEQGTELHQAVAGFKGGQFHRQLHHLPQLITTLWNERDKAKRDHNLAFSQAIKIIMNSFYGVLGAQGCRFFDARLASSITMRGHEIMKQTRILFEERGYEVIYGDTDSLFVNLNKSANIAEADAIGQQLVAEINQWWQQHIASNYALDSYIELEYETHFEKFFMPTIRDSETGSKKRYAGRLTTGEIIFKGLESVRTDWTELAHQFQYQLYQMIFNGVDPSDYIRHITQEVLAGKRDTDLVYAKRLRKKLNDYQKNIPPQVRAARLADHHNQQLGKPLQYQNRGTIRYLITVNGPEPVEYLSSAINYQHYLDKQLRPIADAILPHIGQSFERINQQQLGLF